MRKAGKKCLRSYLAWLLPAAVFAAGISLLLYPTFSDWWNTFRQSRAVDAYTEKVSELDGAQYEEFWEEAEEYNRTLNADSYLHPMTEAEKEKYEAALNIEGNGMMGYVEIPSIDCLLPIYHGTDEAVLQIAVGHMEGTSLPIGGKGTHCVLSSHRGLPSARLFTDLDQLTEGDKFILHVLGEALVYLVDQIKVVEPDELEALQPVQDRDYCTLVTCTPYGVNSHRMLVRGTRIKESVENLSAEPETRRREIPPWLMPVCLSAIFLTAGGCLWFRRGGKGEQD